MAESNTPYNDLPAAQDKPSVITILTDLITSPQKAYRAMQADYPIMFPMFIFFLLMTVSTVLYMNSVDHEWFIEQQVEQLAGDKSKAEQDAIRAQHELMSPMVQSIVGAVFGIIGYLILFCAYSGYYVINSGISNDGYDFKQWLSFVSWAWVPKCLVLILSIVVILMSDNGQISQNSLNPTSLNYLFFDYSASSGFGSLLSMIDLGTVWSWVIMTIGYQVWTKSSLIKSAIITLLPYVVIYGIWAGVAAS